uniref:Uncharacterized protein n=1 Tax=Picea glauca TaxID=3330 RepID=A0A117NIF5_PICGL|nr:hypothetical protein ABT39_MTgene3120 [Picea glauca]QHR86462.1 hypothetical protein Q903MT_gene462 [Picea sitchensis]
MQHRVPKAPHKDILPIASNCWAGIIGWAHWLGYSTRLINWANRLGYSTLAAALLNCWDN